MFDGFPDNTFRLNDPINRGNYTRSLYSLAGAPDISGLPAHDFPDNTYGQDDHINRGNASRTFYNTAQTKPAWADTMAAPPNMLFKNNLTP